MGKRILAFLCTLAMLLGIFVVPATAADTAEDTLFEVGYSKKDLNPWVAYDVFNTPYDPSDDLGMTEAEVAESKCLVDIDIHDYDGERFTGEVIPVKFVQIPLANDANYSSSCMVDDNGDGYVGYGDGIFVTCTSVTDSNGTTVLYLCLDGLNMNDAHTDDVRKEIVNALGSNVIAKERIMISVSHAHATPSYGTVRSINETDPGRKAYYNYVLRQMTAAAVDAFTNKSKATMSKGQIDASDSMKAMGYEDNNGNGWRLNFSRHYNIEGTLQYATVKGNGSGGLELDQSWTNLNGAVDRKFITTPHTALDFQQELRKNLGVNAGDTIYRFRASDRTFESHVSEADDTLYVLQFQREKGNPVVLINWRAHATMNDKASWNILSSDYINALRYRLENNQSKFGGASDYCVGFWQGAAGNITPTTNSEAIELLGENGWKDILLPFEPENPLINKANGFYSDYYKQLSGYDDRFYYTTKYGYLLAMVTLECLNREDSDGNKIFIKDCAAGKILTKQEKYSLPVQTYSDGLKEAAADGVYVRNGGPFAYTDSNGEVYIVNSNPHQTQIKQNRTGNYNLELNVITLGTDVAMVTLPGEPFDRYSDDYVKAYEDVVGDETDRWEIAAAVAENWDDLVETALKDNDWLDLVGGTYGTPFVLGYTNAPYGYLAEAMAYDYNTFEKDDPLSKIFGPGSYEANTAYLEKGSGEKIIDRLGEMLNAITGFDATIDGKQYKIGEAISKYDGSAPIKLIRDITAEVAVNENVTIDLNGYDIDKVIIEDGCTLQCMDSTTDVAIYTGEYGMIKDVDRKGSGKLEGVPATDATYQHSYLMLSEDGRNGEKINYSFHDVFLYIYEMTLRPHDQKADQYNPGVYYGCKIFGDEKVAAAVNANGNFGIALSIQGQPTADNMETQCQYSVSDVDFVAGTQGTEVNSVLLRGVMKETNSDFINSRNANFKIYGSAYIKLGDQVVFGECMSRSLKDLISGSDGHPCVNDDVNESNKADLAKLYSIYQPVMQNWNVPNIKNAYDQSQQVVD